MEYLNGLMVNIKRKNVPAFSIVAILMHYFHKYSCIVLYNSVLNIHNTNVFLPV
jgi:hypothetical protein